MFLRTSEFDAGFGVQHPAIPEPQPAGRLAAPWCRALRALGRLAGRAIAAGRRRQGAAWLNPDLMTDHMLRDLGLARSGALGRDDLLRIRLDGRR